MNTTSVPIKGMHCKSCELLIEDELKKIEGVQKVDVSHKTGLATIYHSSKTMSQNEIDTAIRNAGYDTGLEKKKGFISSNIKDYLDLVYAFFIAGLLFLILKELGLFNISITGQKGYGSYPVVFMVGLTAGVSTCMALVGGLTLGISSRFKQNNELVGRWNMLIPHTFFNIGRIIGFFLLGGLIGALGSVFEISNSITGFITVGVGLFMIFLGVQLTQIIPKLSDISFTLPKGIARSLGITDGGQKQYSHLGTMILGALTFFLPCGFTQAIQLYAVSTGSFIRGGLTMAVFALGTMPGLLGIGSLSAFVKGSFSGLFFKVTGIIVIFLAIFNITNGLNLLKVSAGLSGIDIQKEANTNVITENGYQVARMVQDETGYKPNSFIVKKGLPVKWAVKTVYPYSCASSLMLPKYNIRTLLTEKEQVFEFTPEETGDIPFSCSMGMYSGVFHVVED